MSGTSSATSSTTGGSSGSASIEDRANWHLPAMHPLDTDYTAETTTVTDNVTGLMWQRSLVGSVRRNWANAVNDCQGATTGGFTDWTLPTANELRSLLDQTLSSPAINGTAFPGTPGAANSNFWSSTPDASNDTFAWWVDFSLGTTGSYSKTSFSNYVRCVRNRPAPPGTRYTLNSTDGTVLDNATGLTWQQSPPANPVNWESAPAQCTTPWRLPTTSELFTLLDLSRQSPALDPVFPGVTTECFWSSVPSTTMGFAWRVCFDHGRAAEWDINAAHRVRCVQ